MGDRGRQPQGNAIADIPAGDGAFSAPGAAESPVGQLLLLLAEGPRQVLSRVPSRVFARLEEIRLRAGQPLMVGWAGGEAAVGEEGGFALGPPPAGPRAQAGASRAGGAFRPYLVTREDVSRTLQLITRSSVYALEEELRQGYLTLPGGHRVGLAGQAVLEGGRVQRLRHVGSLCLRIARQVLGAADPVMPFLVGCGPGRPCSPDPGADPLGLRAAPDPEAGPTRPAGRPSPAELSFRGPASSPPRVASALIVSPPLAGKTTVLRDIARQLSEGVPRLGFPGLKVGVVDERSELAACFEGVPQLRLGPRTDVLDACPKAEGMTMLIRATSPQVIVTDEFGRPADAEAAREAMNSGVALITSAHAADLKELLRRPSLKDLLAEGAFRWIVLLGESLGRGTVEAVFDGRTMEPVLAAPLAPGPAVGLDSPEGLEGQEAALAPAVLEVTAGVVQDDGRRPGARGLRLVRPDGGL
ncbi:MAG: hypothetical protein K6T75_00270 [Acetobacteraceae bacterium]|nr:hypothetical protein [Acetobacteraceae bacterium]